VRLNAVFALLNAIDAEALELEAMESILIASLDDPCGYVADIGCEALIRMGDGNAPRTVVRHLQRRRWDDTLMGGIRTY
jgi:hypothetical protein